MVVVGFVVVIAALAHFAPPAHDLHQPASVNLAPAGICGYESSPPVSVTLINNAGYNEYRAICANGVPVMFDR
jgi:hypothetical protein